jgi:GR25 family glycosyltransferase involved in LPS biosynthesis
MNVVVVSLARAQERRKHMIEQLEKLPTYNWHILQAVDGGELSGKELDKRIHLPGGWRYGETMVPAEIATIMSHSNAIKLAKDNDWPYVLVLEDDAELCEDFEKRVNYLLRILPSDWQQVYLSGIPKAGPFFFPVLGLMNVLPSIFTECIPATLIRKSIYDKIINYYSFFWTTADDMICQLVAEGMKSYTFYPFVAYAKDQYSYIWDKPLNREHKSKKYYKNKI